MRGMLSVVTCFVLLLAADAQSVAPREITEADVVAPVVAPEALVTIEPNAAPEPAVVAQPQPVVVSQPLVVPQTPVAQPSVVPAAPVVAPAPVVPAPVVPAPVVPAPVVPAPVVPAPVVPAAAVPAPAVPAPVVPAPVVVPEPVPVVVAPVPVVVAEPVVVPEPSVADEPSEDAEAPLVVPEASVADEPAVAAEPTIAVSTRRSAPDLFDKHPYVVSLRRRSDLEYICAGVLIGKKHVLTAAHCVDAFLLGGDVMPRVVVGSDSSTKKSGRGIQVLATTKVDFNPGSAAGRPDLAILTLKKAAKARPASLPSKRFTPAPESVLTALGWGRPTEFGRRSKVLKSVEMKFVERNTCETMLGKFVPSFNVCMGGAGVGTCEGDNGGPVILDGSPDLLVAIVGEDHACGEKVIDTHGSVSDAMEWIESVIGSS